MSDDETDLSVPPPMIPDLPPLSSLTKKPPSPLLRFHLMNIIYCYAYTMRLFNGDIGDDFEGAIGVLFDLCAVIGDPSISITSAMEAIGEPLLAAQKVLSSFSSGPINLI